MKNIPIRKIDTAHKALHSTEGFSIRDLTNLLNGKDLFHALHRHDYFFILALQKGMGMHEIDFTAYKVHNHSIFILRPGQVHRLQLKADCTGYLMEFSPGFYQPNNNSSTQRLSRASNKNVCTLELARFTKLFSLLAYIFTEFTEKQKGYEEIIKANLEIFFIEFIRQSQNPQGALKESNNYSQERLEDFLQLLSAQFLTLKQVSQYAALLNLSAYQLNSITKATVGKAASVLITEQIILEAKRYLLATTNQVKDIASHLGYEDPSYFVRFFRKHTGYSPDAFRKKPQ